MKLLGRAQTPAAAAGGARAASSPLRAWWNHTQPRERRMMTVAVAVVALALLWWLALAPALATLKSATTAARELDAQEQTMQRLKAEAEVLKAAPRLPRAQALAALEGGVRERLGTHASVQVLGDGATVTLKDVPAASLAAWLADARANARAVPSSAQLTRSPGGAGTHWSGSVQLRLPPAE